MYRLELIPSIPYLIWSCCLFHCMPMQTLASDNTLLECFPKPRSCMNSKISPACTNVTVGFIGLASLPAKPKFWTVQIRPLPNIKKTLHSQTDYIIICSHSNWRVLIQNLPEHSNSIEYILGYMTPKVLLPNMIIVDCFYSIFILW